MTLIKFSPFREIETLENQIQKIFNDLPLTRRMSGSFNPAIDLREDEKNLYLTAELPGIEKEEVKISLHNDVLTISGERKREEKKEKAHLNAAVGQENYYHLEMCYGTFNRSVTLPVEVDNEKIEANFKNGILKIQLPKINPKDISKTIEIK
ncbi:MAG: Hsp20/alpha crystallin family protein [Bacteroidota bacterium]|nr:Hsp20/alpha crystallin family protein [Bacteroidota bacterium]